MKILAVPFLAISLGACTIDVAAIQADADAVARALQSGARIADTALNALSASVCGSMTNVVFEVSRLKSLNPAPNSRGALALSRADAALLAANTYCATYQTSQGSGLVAKFIALVNASKAAKAAVADAKLATGA